MTVTLSGPLAPATEAAAGQGAAPKDTAMAGDPAMAAPTAAVAALALRDQALAALDGGHPAEALATARRGLAALEAAGLWAGPDEAALLIAVAEIEEALGRFGQARLTIAVAAGILDGAAPSDDDTLLLWCQAQERLAGLERVAGEFAAATARLGAVLDRASAAFGEASRPVVSAANALGVVGKYAGDFGTAEAAYRRAVAALDRMADRDPLAEAGLLHNLGGLAHARNDPEAGIPPAERGVAVRASVLGDDHPDVARDLNALGALYHQAGRHSDAADAYRRALSRFEAAYGPSHFEVAMTCANLAVLHGDQGDFGLAEALGRRSLRILESVLGPDDAEVGLTLLNLAAAVAGRGRHAEAAVLNTRAAVILADRLPADHPYVLAATDALAYCGRPS